MGLVISPKYFPLKNDTRYTIVTGGRGSGKSFAVALFLLNLLKKYSGHKILFTRYTMTAARISIIPEFEEKINLLGYQNDFEILNNEIVCKSSGSMILFRGIKTSSGNQTANLKSLQGVTTWVLDEAEELDNEKIFDTINLSIRSKYRNRVIMVLNPATKEHFLYKRFYELKDKDCTYIHTDYLDNKDNLSDSFLTEVERIKKTNPQKYEHVILGNWLDKLEGLIFTNWETGEFDESLPFAFGQDFGYTDPTTLVKVALDSKNHYLYVKECFYESNLSVDQIYKRNLEHAGRDGLIIADSAEPRLIAELDKRKLNIKRARKGKGSIGAGIKGIQDYKIIVSPGSNHIIKELNHYVWNDKKANIPIDMYNHILDGVRYAFEVLKPKKRAKINL